MSYLTWIYRTISFSGCWLIPALVAALKIMNPEQGLIRSVMFSMLPVGWVLLNNTWSLLCEGKTFKDFHLGDGLIPDTGLKKESAQKKRAVYPNVPKELTAKNAEGIILGKVKGRYVRVPLDTIYHYCVLGGSGSGKTSTILISTLLANFAAKRDDFMAFVIDIKGEIYRKTTYRHSEQIQVVDPSDRTSFGWDVYYRLRDNASDDRIIEAMEEIAQALIISTNSNDLFFVENGRTMFTGLLIYYFKRGETFIDAVNHILEADAKILIEEIIRNSEPDELHYKYLAKYTGKTADSVQDIMTEMTTSLSIFSKSDIRYCLRDNIAKASPYSFETGKSIFLAIPEHLLESYKPVMRLCTVQVLRELERRNEEETKPVLVIIDEFARIGKVEGIMNALSTLRSKKVMIMLLFQSLGQCETIYSKAETRVLVDNCRVKMVCEASDPEICRSIKDWAGTYREKRESVTTGRNRSKSYSYEDKSVLESADLLTLTKNDEVLLFISGVGYLRVKKCFYFRDALLSKLAESVREYNKHFRGDYDDETRV